MNWNTKFPQKDGFYIVSFSNGNVGIAYFDKCTQRGNVLIKNTWNTREPVVAYVEIPKHYIDNKCGWEFCFDGDNLPPVRGRYLVSIVEQKSYGQIKKVADLFYEAKKDEWYGLPRNADVIAWRSFPQCISKLKGDKKMKATGIVRRVDELGRIVLPKELRRTSNISSGDCMEIFSDDNGMICLRKYITAKSEQSLSELRSCVVNDIRLDSEAKEHLLGKIVEIEKILRSQKEE